MMEFIDAQAMHQKHPDTFNAPTAAELQSIKPNCQVKIAHNQERFWVTVTKVDGNQVEGVVDNQLVMDHPFDFGDTVCFHKRHVYDCMQ